MGAVAAVAGLLAPIALAILDDVVVNASTLHAASLAPWWRALLKFSGLVTGMVVHHFLGPLVVAAAALVCALYAPWRRYARPLVFVALCWAIAWVGMGIFGHRSARPRSHARAALETLTFSQRSFPTKRSHRYCQRPLGSLLVNGYDRACSHLKLSAPRRRASRPKFYRPRCARSWTSVPHPTA